MLLLVALGKMIKSKYCRYQYKAIRSSPKTFHSAKDYLQAVLAKSVIFEVKACLLVKYIN